MGTIEAIYEGGVFRPIVPVMLPDNARVQLQILNQTPASANNDEDMQAIYEILDRRYSSGFTDTAARHNEHQP
ncbi:MAG TPA: antitoxin family protein [Lacipirellulaceae bacterium]